MLFPVLLSAVLAAPLGASDVVAYHSSGRYAEVAYEASLVWEEGIYVLDLWAPRGEAGANLTKARQSTETLLEAQMEGAFLQSLADLPVSSLHTIGTMVREEPRVLAGLKALAAAARKTRSHLTPDLEQVRLRYLVPLYGAGGLMGAVAPAGEPAGFERYLGFVPGAEYSGLLIYARGTYPAWGKAGEERAVRACLLPRIFDDQMGLVWSAAHVHRDALLEWGPVSYSGDLELTEAQLGRIGAAPLRVLARGVFGTNDTDLIVSGETARRLLGRESAMQALREGRVVVVLDASAPPEDLLQQESPEAAR